MDVNKLLGKMAAYGELLRLELWFGFVCTAGAAIAYPGPTMLTVVSYALTHVRRSYLPLLAAVALGDSTALALSFLCVHLLEASQLWLMIATCASGAYLVFFGVKRLRADNSPAKLNKPPETRSRWQLFANTYLVTGMNPKSIPLLMVLLNGFVDKSADVTQQRWILAVTFVALSSIVATLYMIFAASARKLIRSPRVQHVFHIAGGVLLLIAGLWALGYSLLWVLKQLSGWSQG